MISLIYYCICVKPGAFKTSTRKRHDLNPSRREEIFCPTIYAIQLFFNHLPCSFCGCPPLSTLVGLTQTERLPCAHVGEISNCWKELFFYSSNLFAPNWAQLKMSLWHFLTLSRELCRILVLTFFCRRFSGSAKIKLNSSEICRQICLYAKVTSCGRQTMCVSKKRKQT